MSFFSMCIFYLFHGVHFPCRAFSMSCFFHVVHFLFFCFPGVLFLSFSGCDFSAIFRVCIFHCHFLVSTFLSFSSCAFCHFPVCAFCTFFMSCIFHSFIFHVVH